jgi:transposase
MEGGELMHDFSDIRILLCTTPTNMCYSFDSLMGQAQQIFKQDPLSGHLFLFFNRSRDRIKILFWDRDGFCIWYKRLERGTFQIPRAEDGEQALELTYDQLTKLLGGIDLYTGRKRRRYRLPSSRKNEHSVRTDLA